MVVHVRRDGHWQMTMGRDDPYVPTSNEDFLQDIGWMVGEWSPKNAAHGPKLKVEWMAQKNFIRNSITKIKDQKTTLSSVQVIGWNPKLGAIVSWHFDANGGFGNDRWTQDGSKWLIEATGLSRNGDESSALNVITPINANSFRWQSFRRTLNGKPLPDAAPVVMVRVAAGK